MQNTSLIIDALGGTVAVARALNLTPSVVSSWRGNNSIPRWWHRPLIELSGGTLKETDFPTRRRTAA